VPNTADPVAAVTEAEAHGEIADIYADIRQTLGVDVVNLVWRHLATIDGGLAWAWTSLKPAYINGAVTAQAERMKHALLLPKLPTMTSDILATAGVDSEASLTIRAIQASYDRSNSMNFLALTALIDNASCRLSQDDHKSPAVRIIEPEESLGPLPPLPPLDQMSPEHSALLERLNQLAQTRDDAIMVSMYRQLSYWPGYLGLIWALMAPLAADGRLQRLVAATEVAAHPHINALITELIIKDEHPAANAALQDFLDRVNLPKMIVIARMLNATMPAEDQP